jgi:predicted secreted hydrolase
MATTGALRLGDETFEVAGASWMDHEFGTSVLEAGQRGWDWFSLQLDDGSELMVFQLRREDGSRDPRSAGTLVGPAGEQTALAVGDFTLVPGARWSSDATRAQYPIAWQLVIPSRGLELSVRALVPNQELTTPGSTGVTYWEGAVEVDGLARGRRLGGRGYLEMTGYAGQPMSAVLR